MVQTRNLDQYAELHRTKAYGQGSDRARRAIAPWVRLRNPKSILDYGSGQSKLVNLLLAPNASIRDRYDPAIPAIASIPRPSYDLVTCTDVLEHLDESEIDEVLAQIRGLTAHAILAADTRAAATILPNGENAHATIQPPDWWQRKISAVFGLAELIEITGSSAIFRTWKAGPTQRTIAAFLKPFLRRS